MNNEISKEIVVHITEQQTIIELSQLIQPFQSEIFLTKLVNGTLVDVNLKSFLGLINLQLGNGDQLTVRAEGNDCKAAIEKVIDYLT